MNKQAASDGVKRLSELKVQPSKFIPGRAELLVRTALLNTKAFALVFSLCILTLIPGCSSPYLPIYNTSAISLVTPYVSISDVSRISHYVVTSSGGHNGFDFLATQNMTMRAAAAGTVMDVERKTNSVHGVLQVNLRIRINDKYTTVYNFEPFTTTISEIEAQEAAILVAAGDHVSQGQIIGTLLPYDSSAHVHFGVKEYADEVCPETFFADSDAAAMLALYQSSTGSTQDLCVVE